MKSAFLRAVWREGPAVQAFRHALRRLGPDDIAIDCGANLGHYTRAMAATGAQVFAFEPNPYAFEQLSRRFAGRANVTCLNKAVGADAAMRTLYLHRRSPEDPVRFAFGSSLLSFKGNIDRANTVRVEVVDFITFIRSLGRGIGLVKMDIEGAEIEILERLLQSDLKALRIEKMFIEMHDRKVPQLEARAQAIRATIDREAIDWIDLRWH